MFERCQRADCDIIGWKTKKAFLKRRVWKLIKEFLTDCVYKNKDWKADKKAYSMYSYIIYWSRAWNLLKDVYAYYEIL